MLKKCDGLDGKRVGQDWKIPVSNLGRDEKKKIFSHFQSIDLESMRSSYKNLTYFFKGCCPAGMDLKFICINLMYFC